MAAKAPGIVFPILGLAALADAATTALGIASVIHPTRDRPGSLVICIVPAAVILVILLLTPQIWSSTAKGQAPMRFLWLVAFLYDGYTSFVANMKLVVLTTDQLLLSPKNLISTVAATQIDQFVMIVVGTIFISGSPVLLSFLLVPTER